jgi:two-component system NtrC family sensor kinase
MSLSETVRLADMLRKMLSFSKPEQEERSATDINKILDELIMLHEKQLQEHDIKVYFDLEEGLEPVHASPNQLRQVFLNMIANARDAMPDGGSLTIATTRQNSQIRVDITDTGAGIKEENIGKIFDSFFTTKSSVKGVGLGLSVCYGFIKEHGGDIQVESTPGSGTRFTITLPFQPLAESA